MDYDVIILGAGSMGMSAGYYLTKKGQRVLLIDQFDPPHTLGSHHGSTRIIRHAYGEGDYYVELALKSQQLLLELQQTVGEQLFIPTGVLNMGRSDSAFIRNVKESAEKFSLPVEILSAKEVHEKWAGLKLPNQYIGVFETNSGVLMSEKVVGTYRKVAEALGATMKVNTVVESVSLKNDGVVVKTATETFSARHLIVATGAGTSELSRLLGITLPLAEIRKTFSWFNCEEEDYGDDCFPAFTFTDDNHSFYGFPSIDGAGVKIGRHDEGQPRNMKETILPFGSFAEDEGEVMAFAQNYLPKVGAHKEGATCTYTLTPDEDFIIDTHPDHAHVHFACGFSGHGFKFCGAVGEMLAQRIVDGEAEIDLSKFALSRFSD